MLFSFINIGQGKLGKPFEHFDHGSVVLISHTLVDTGLIHLLGESCQRQNQVMGLG